MKCVKRTVYETAVSTTPMKIAIDERFSSHDSRNRKLLILRGTKVIFGRTQHRACGSPRPTLSDQASHRVEGFTVETRGRSLRWRGLDLFFCL